MTRLQTMRSLLAASVLFSGLAARVALADPYVAGQDSYEFRYEVKMPELKTGDKAELWLPLASSDAFQTVERTVSAPGLKVTESSDPDFNNTVLHVTAGPADAAKTVTVDYKVKRLEKTAYAADPKAKLDLYLRSERLVPRNDRFKKIATEVTAGRTTTQDKARALYDYVFKEMKYDKSGSGWGRGDATYACDAKTGNCTDFHALFIALARSIGIPASFAIGFTIPAEGTAGKIAGYHCWAEVLADGKWLPVDISEAAKAPQFKDYYFGHHPANRLQLSQGRDLKLAPTPAEGLVNFLVYPYVEVNGKAVKGTAASYSYSRAKRPEVRS